MPDFDLDQFKESWQEQNSTTKYNQTEILQMLNRKSRNYVKYILWVSIIEFVFVVAMNIYYFSTETETENFSQILSRLGVKSDTLAINGMENIYTFIKILSIAIIVVFVVVFYIDYKKINIENSLKQLITRIINFKKAVNYFIYTNILFLIFATALFLYNIFHIANSQNINIDNSTLVGLGVGVFVGLAFSILLIWLYYKLVYGIIISRLSKNLEQLKVIEQEKEENPQ